MTQIPEEIQRPMRSRLQLLRESMSKSRADIRTVTSGTMIRYEQHDLSSLRLGDLFGLAGEFGLSFDDFIQYLIGENVSPMLDKETRSQKRMTSYLRALPADKQETACELIRVLVDSEDRADARPRQLDRRDARESIMHAIREGSSR